MKKIFGDINLTWPKVIIMAIIMGIYPAVMAMIPVVRGTSFTDLTVTFEVWILFGIFIIMNSKSPLDSALKCFVFFLISQPLIYLVQDLFNHSSLFNTYYSNWVLWTIGCLPMGYVGYYMKKDKWWGLLILTPMLLLLGYCYCEYLSLTMFSFPLHVITTIFCLITLIVYPICIFKDKKIKMTGVIISSIIIVVATIICIIKPNVYSTDILSDSDYHFDNTYKVYIDDNKYGDLSIKYIDRIEAWMIHAEFKHAGTTKFVLEAPNGDKKTFDLTIKRDTYDVEERK